MTNPDPLSFYRPHRPLGDFFPIEEHRITYLEPVFNPRHEAGDPSNKPKTMKDNELTTPGSQEWLKKEMETFKTEMSEQQRYPELEAPPYHPIFGTKICLDIPYIVDVEKYRKAVGFRSRIGGRAKTAVLTFTMSRERSPFGGADFVFSTICRPDEDGSSNIGDDITMNEKDGDTPFDRFKAKVLEVLKSVVGVDKDYIETLIFTNNEMMRGLIEANARLAEARDADFEPLINENNNGETKKNQ